MAAPVKAFGTPIQILNVTAVNFGLYSNETKQGCIKHKHHQVKDNGCSQIVTGLGYSKLVGHVAKLEEAKTKGKAMKVFKFV